IRSFGSSPDAGDIVARALEDEILPIRGPGATTFTGWLVPTFQEGVKAGSIERNFPERQRCSLEIIHSKSQVVAVGRKHRFERHSGYRCELASVTSISLDQV